MFALLVAGPQAAVDWEQVRKKGELFLGKQHLLTLPGDRAIRIHCKLEGRNVLTRTDHHGYLNIVAPKSLEMPMEIPVSGSVSIIPVRKDTSQ